MTKLKNTSFIKRDNITSKIEEIILSETSNKNLGIRTNFCPDSITECPRKLIYMVMGDGKNVNIDYLKLTSDIYSKKKWIEYFSKFKAIKLLETNLVVADCNYNISGILDAVINMEGKILAVKIFPVSSQKFATIKENGASKKNIIEVLVYMWLAEVKDGLAIYENKDTHEYITYHIEPYKPIISAVKEKCLLLSEYKIKGNIPNRPYKESGSNECSNCEFLNKCWRK